MATNLRPYAGGTDHEGKPCVRGPQMEYYSTHLNPQLLAETPERAQDLAYIANTAYETGYKQAQADLRRAMGIDQ